MILSDVAEITMGQSPPGTMVSADPKGLPLLNGPTEFGPHHPNPVQYTADVRKRAQPGDILFCVRGSTTGRMNWADRPFAIGRGIAAIRHKHKPELQPLVRAAIEVGLPALRAQATGSTFPNVSAAQLAAIPFPVLPESSQHDIADILRSIDDKIELNRRINETLEAQAAIIFDSIFLSAKCGPVGAVVKVCRDLVDPQESLGEYFDHYSIPAFDLDRNPGVELGASIKSAKLLVADDSVLVSRLNPKESRVWLPSRANRTYRAICSTEFLVAVPKGGPEEREFIYGLFSSKLFCEEIAGRATGTSNSHQRVRPEDLLNIECQISSVNSRREYSALVRPLLERIARNRDESVALAGIRDALLPRLLSGELRS